MNRNFQTRAKVLIEILQKHGPELLEVIEERERQEINVKR